MARQSARRTDSGVVKPILAAVLGDEMAEAIIEFRDDVKKAPMTEMAAKLQVKEYLKTGNPIAAAEMQILRNWVSIKADWYLNEIRRSPAMLPQPLRQTPFQQRHQAAINAFDRDLGTSTNDQFASDIDLEPANWRTH